MPERKLTESQQKRIDEIKEQWKEEIIPLFEKWDKEYEEDPLARCVLDKHLREQTMIEKKYMDMIQAVKNEPLKKFD